MTQALNVTPDDFLEWAPTEDKGYLIVLNLAGLGFIFHPLLGVITPLLMWILKKDRIKLVDDSGKKLISFQITFALLIYSLMFILNEGNFLIFDISAMNIISGLIGNLSTEALLIALLYIYDISLILINIRRNQKGLKSKYIPSIPFLR